MSVDSERRPLIAHIIFTLSTGGMENGLVNIINRMPAGKYRHLIICLTEADSFAKRITADNVEIIELHMREGHDFDCYRRLRKCLKQLRPDIVHSRNIAALEAQLFTLGLSGLKRVHGEHGREIFDLDGSNWKYLVLRKFMRLFIDRYIAVSRDLEQWLTASVGVSPGRIRQIYNGVDHERFAPDGAKPLALLPKSWQALDGMLIAGTVGRLTPVKDQQILLRAVASLRGKYPALAKRLRVILVGDGPLRTDIERLSAQLGLQEVVWLTGDRADVPELLKLMDVFLLPSLGEGISNTVLEAMASGCPIIATAVGGNVELVDNGSTGALVPVGDQGALEHAMLNLLSDEQGRREQGLNARQKVCRDFDWEHTVASYMSVYDVLL